MLEIKGKYCKDIKIFTDNIEESALSTLYHIAELRPYGGKKIRIMPDVHQGVGDSVIGFSCPVGLNNDFISPSVVGCDLGCSVSCTFFNKGLTEEEIVLLEHSIKQKVAFGFDFQTTTLVTEKEIINRFQKAMDILCSRYPVFKNYALSFKCERDLEKWCDNIHMDYGRFLKSIGSVGGGNHYVEYDVNDELGKYAICVHCGSRNLGQKVYKYWNNLAKTGGISKTELKNIIEGVKKNNTDKKLLQEQIKKAKEEYLKDKVPDFLTGDCLMGYLVDVVLAQEYAKINHEYIHRIISDEYKKICKGSTDCGFIYTTHNYIDYDFNSKGTPNIMIRKGAIRSYKGEEMIIPFNMRDGIAICEGKSNEDWNCTAPHGAGRIMSRAKAKQTLSVDDFKKTMSDANIYTTTADITTLDEAPMAYKAKEEIVNLIQDTCKILYFMVPKMNIKAAE